ncbi:class I SAM-dependent methyltransferase [Streptacidiphilus melanogenes]|uniref:class I SAM-dependent methyltransferase n=1 Tax=Streptacidiphilus melanogenes TaxID=411235 RepID=UPI0005A908D7|nr:class I SAM-dependent methyltransferase [Streptacidiphilus melanogenes]
MAPRQAVRHPVFARLWSKAIGPALEKAGIAEHRRRLLAGLTGEVVEIGAGNGLNFAHYPPEVTRVLAVEPEPDLRALAEQAALTASVPVEVVAGRAERIPAAEESFDAAVVCLTLCSIPNQHAALTELWRVLRPGGELRFFEHVQAESPRMRRVQRAVDATFWPLLAGGCRTGRDTRSAIEAAGFTITELDAFAFPETRVPSPSTPHILGTAVR